MCRAISLQRLNFSFDVSVTLNLFYNQDTTGIYFGVLNNRYTFWFLTQYRHTFNGHFLRQPMWVCTRISPFRILLERRVMEVHGGDNWRYIMCKAPVKSSPNQWINTQLFTGRMPFLSSNQQCQSTEGDILVPANLGRPGKSLLKWRQL